MEKQPKATGQQDTNAALAALAAAGNSFALGQLWEINKGLLHRWFWQWYSKNKAVADEHGLTLEDFDQEGFFAVQAAAKAYEPRKRFLCDAAGLLCAKPDQQGRVRRAQPPCDHRGRQTGKVIRKPAEHLHKP